ncbi:hypothetical protein D3C77_509620 [compost metagenome]
MFAVADHQRLRRVQRLLGQQVGDQLDLIGAGAVEFAAVDHLEVMIEFEMAGNLTGEFPGLGCGDVQRPALPVQAFEQRLDTLEYQVLVQSGDLETFTVEVHRIPGSGLVEAVELHERLQQRRADEVFQACQVRFIDTEFAQGVLDGTGNTQTRVGQGAVEVEEDILLVHGCLANGCRQVHSGRW